MSILSYLNNSYRQTYPFIQQIPFGNFFIESVRIGLKQKAEHLYLTRLDVQPEQCIIGLSTQSGLIGQMQYSDQNLWMSIDNEYAFGFVKLRVKPQTSIHFHGRLQLNKDTFTCPVDIGGTKKITSGLQTVQITDSLQILVKGNLQVSQTVLNYTDNNESDSSVVYSNPVYIRRSKDVSSDFASLPMEDGKYIGTVNGLTVSQLYLIGTDCVTIQNPIPVNDTVYVMYVNSQSCFPACAETSAQDSFSDSQ